MLDAHPPVEHAVPSSDAFFDARRHDSLRAVHAGAPAIGLDSKLPRRIAVRGDAQLHGLRAAVRSEVDSFGRVRAMVTPWSSAPRVASAVPGRRASQADAEPIACQLEPVALVFGREAPVLAGDPMTDRFDDLRDVDPIRLRALGG
jgi:hypothetical protein